MNIKELISPLTIFLTVLFLFELISDIIFNFDPIYEHYRYLKENHFVWAMSANLLFLLLLVLYDRHRSLKRVEQKLKLFNTTIHTIQDKLQVNYSEMQILVMDMDEQKVPHSIIDKANSIQENIIKIINTLKDINPLETKTHKVTDSISVFKTN